MGVKQVTCYIAECDDCGKEHEYDYTPHWPSEQEARHETVNISEWYSGSGVLVCDDCKVKPHAHVPDPRYPDDCDRCGNPVEEHEPVEAKS
uniref:hypothetical protein n=1 Tax=Paractinoplanes polyasparticus TaxID=2856853 RepID=UPI001C852F37|nr:hypothetical protein [Actinoplanes polyasparticus]